MIIFVINFLVDEFEVFELIEKNDEVDMIVFW